MLRSKEVLPQVQNVALPLHLEPTQERTRIMTSSEQARADAMADAETLRRNARLWWREWDITTGAVEACTVTPSNWSPEISYQSASRGARAAFRAVPGLRGE